MHYRYVPKDYKPLEIKIINQRIMVGVSDYDIPMLDIMTQKEYASANMIGADGTAVVIQKSK